MAGAHDGARVAARSEQRDPPRRAEIALVALAGQSEHRDPEPRQLVPDAGQGALAGEAIGLADREVERQPAAHRVADRHGAWAGVLAQLAEAALEAVRAEAEA